MTQLALSRSKRCLLTLEPLFPTSYYGLPSVLVSLMKALFLVKGVEGVEVCWILVP